MFTSGARRGFALRELRPRLFVIAVLATMGLPAVSPNGAIASGAESHGAVASAAAAFEHLHAAQLELGRKTRALRRCERTHPHACSKQTRAVERARVRLRGVTARYSQFRGPQSKSQQSPTTSSKSAPSLGVAGDTLTWSKVGTINTYVLSAKYSGKEITTDVTGTSATPSSQAGETVLYRVRTDISGSAWSNYASVTYPSAAPVASPSKEPVAETTESALEKGGASGSGSGSGSSSTGSPSESTSIIPSSVPQTGIVSGSEPLDYEGATKLGAKLVRLGCGVEQSVKELEPVIAQYAARGIRVLPLAEFYGTLPTAAEAQNLASWAKAFGSGGSFWKAHPADREVPMEDIEFGNETSYSYQYSNDTTAGYASRAETYALRFAEAAKAIRAANPGVGLLAQGDSGNAGSTWISSMFKAVPNLGELVGGWTVHPYGSGWRTKLERLVSETTAAGAPSTIPVDITEWGLTTDGGTCLNVEYGLNPCMSYEEAASTLTTTFAEMRQLLGSRFGMFMLYQVRDQKDVALTTNGQSYFGALQHELQPKGSYTTAVDAVMALQ